MFELQIMKQINWKEGTKKVDIQNYFFHTKIVLYLRLFLTQTYLNNYENIYNIQVCGEHKNYK